MTDSLRVQFPILGREINGRPMIYLDNAATTQKPRRVLDVLNQFYTRHNANVHRGVHTLSREATDLFEASRETVRDFLNAESDEEIIWVRGVTESVNLIAGTFGRTFDPGDEIVLTGMEHHADIVPWQMLAREKNLKIRVLPFNDRGELEIDRLPDLFSPRTRMVGAVHVSNVLGTVNPVKKITDIAHGHGVPVFIDGAQALAHRPVDVRDIGCDMYAVSSHKAYGPTGIGALYVRRKILETWPPYHGGGEMIQAVEFGRDPVFSRLPFRFEAGTPHMAGTAGFAEALRFIRETGFDTIRAGEEEILKAGRRLLPEVPGLRFIGDAADKVSVFSFVIDGIHPLDVGSFLDARGIAVRTGHHCAQPVMKHYGIPGTVRASFALYNTKEEMDRLADTLKDAVSLLA